MSLKLHGVPVLAILVQVGCASDHYRIYDQWHVHHYYAEAFDESGKAVDLVIPRRSQTGSFLMEESHNHVTDADIEDLNKVAVRDFLISNEKRWKRFWEPLNKPAPEIDFSRFFVIGTTRMIAGDVLKGFYIGRIEKRDHGFVVYVRTQILPPGHSGPCVVDGGETDLVKVRRTHWPFVLTDDPFWIFPEESNIRFDTLYKDSGEEAEPQ